MTKLYYDDALQAAYMMREFGVKLETYSASEFADLLFDTTAHNIHRPDRDYIHIDSLHIFEPMEGDLTTWIKGIHKGCPHYFHNECSDIEGGYHTIIQRNSKPFFMAKEG